MSVTEVIEALRAMTPSEREQIRLVIDNLSDEPAEREAQALASLQRAGLLRRRTSPRQSARERKPIEISGKPLSETIIEERR